MARQAPLSMGILQARILEWAAIFSPRGSSWPRDRTSLSWVFCIEQVYSLPTVPPGKPLFIHVCAVLSCSGTSDSLWAHGLQPASLLCSWNSPGKNPRIGCHALLQGIFPTQGSNTGLPHCRQIFFYWLSHQESPLISYSFIWYY